MVVQRLTCCVVTITKEVRVRQFDTPCTLPGALHGSGEGHRVLRVTGTNNRGYAAHIVVKINRPDQVSAGQRRDHLANAVIDQFARNMFRGTPQAYEHDLLALEAARVNVEKGFYRYYFSGYQKLFIVYPLMHHESLASQAMCLHLLRAINEHPDYRYQFLNAMQKGMEHYQMIFMFGRFPHRNQRLGRETTEKEKAYLAMKGTPGFVDGSKW